MTGPSRWTLLSGEQERQSTSPASYTGDRTFLADIVRSPVNGSYQYEQVQVAPHPYPAISYVLYVSRFVPGMFSVEP